MTFYLHYGWNTRCTGRISYQFGPLTMITMALWCFRRHVWSKVESYYVLKACGYRTGHRASLSLTVQTYLCPSQVSQSPGSSSMTRTLS